MPNHSLRFHTALLPFYSNNLVQLRGNVMILKDALIYLSLANPDPALMLRKENKRSPDVFGTY